MRVPSLTIDVDGRELTGPEAAVVSLSVQIGIGHTVDGATVALAAQSPVVNLGPGAEVQLDLGYSDDNETVLTGDVVRVTQRPWGILVDLVALPGRMHRHFVGRSYLDQSPADIIADLASEAEVPTGDLASSDTLSVYHLDETRSMWQHANNLADLAGGFLRTDPNGAISMTTLAPAGGLGGLAGAAIAAGQDLLGLGGGWRFGAELLDASISPTLTSTAPAVAPYGAASPLGSDSWHLLVREPAGGPPGNRTLVPAAVRTEAAASALASAIEAASERHGTTAKVTTLGQPGVRPGDPVSIADWPLGDPDDLEVESIRHRLDRDRGFISEIELVAAA